MLNTIIQISLSLIFFVVGTSVLKWPLLLTTIGSFLVYTLGVLIMPNKIRIGNRRFDENAISMELEALYSGAEKRMLALKNASNQIKAEDIKSELDTILKTGDDIMLYLRENPEEISRSRNFLEIELPETVDVINKYKKVENAYGNSRNMNEVKEDVLESLSILRESYDEQKLSYYQSDLKQIEITSEALKSKKDTL